VGRRVIQTIKERSDGSRSGSPALIIKLMISFKPVRALFTHRLDNSANRKLRTHFIMQFIHGIGNPRPSQE